MKRKDIFFCILFTAGAIYGWYRRDYVGGSISGSCITIVITYFLGRWQLNREANRLDRIISAKKSEE